MNTLRDTAEGRARPSVWPVYLAAAVIGAVSIPVLFLLVECLRTAAEEGEGVLVYWRPFLWITSIGLFGFVTAWGLVRLRLWGWWCTVVWTSISTAVLVLICAMLLAPTDSPSLGVLVFLFVAPLGLVAIVLLVWVLATRRRLFFPPEGLTMSNRWVVGNRWGLLIIVVWAAYSYLAWLVLSERLIGWAAVLAFVALIVVEIGLWAVSLHIGIEILWPNGHGDEQ